MPALGADMEAGTIVEWLVKPGDAVKRGDIIAVVDTEKATIEVEVFETGVIQEILVPLGEKVPIGTLLALIRTDGEIVAPPAAKPTPVAAPPKVAPPAIHARLDRRRPLSWKRLRNPRMPPAAPGRLRISPLAMRTAIELKVDLSTVKGTGPHGAITRADVEKAAKAPKAVPPPAPSPAEKAPAPTARAGSGGPRRRPRAQTGRRARGASRRQCAK